MTTIRQRTPPMDHVRYSINIGVKRKSRLAYLFQKAKRAGLNS